MDNKIHYKEGKLRNDNKNCLEHGDQVNEKQGGDITGYKRSLPKRVSCCTSKDGARFTAL